MGKSFKCSLAFVAIVYHILLQRNPHVLRGILIIYLFIGKTHTHLIDFEPAISPYL